MSGIHLRDRAVTAVSRSWHTVERDGVSVAGVTPSSEISVAVIEDERSIRECLQILIDGSEGLRCSGVFRTMEGALEQLAADPPQVALVDIGLPGMSGIDGVRVLRERFPDLRPIILTVHEDNDRIFDALCAGACGYLLKRASSERMLAAIREVVAGGAPMSPEVASRVVALFRTVRPAPHTHHHLTPHELRLLQLLIDGRSYKSAAEALGVTSHTVSFHLRRIYEKLQVHSKTEAVAKALRQRLIR